MSDNPYQPPNDPPPKRTNASTITLRARLVSLVAGLALIVLGVYLYWTLVPGALLCAIGGWLVWVAFFG